MDREYTNIGVPMRFVFVVFICAYHSVARQCVHCCKGDAESQWEMAMLGYQNSVTPGPIDKNLTHVIMSVS